MAETITKNFDFIIDSAAHAVSKKNGLELLRGISLNYFVEASIIKFINYVFY